MLLVIVALIGSLAGPALLALGMRGKRIDDHPLCAACGFDLFGKPKASTACAECGADLSRDRAIRIGHRSHNRPLVAMGALLLGLGVLTSIGELHRIRSKTNLLPYLPTWVLLRAIDMTDPSLRDGAVKELCLACPGER